MSLLWTVVSVGLLLLAVGAAALVSLAWLVDRLTALDDLTEDED